MLVKYINNPNKQYIPSVSNQYNIPKKGFTLRYSLETNIFDRLVYQGIVDILIDSLDEGIPSCVYSHRKSRAKNSKYIFQNPIEAWKDFQLHLTSELKKSPSKVLLVTDIQNFFENIQLKDIRKSILRISKNLMLGKPKERKIKAATTLIIRLLKKWSFSEAHGIPQNRDASSFLANLLMEKLDSKMIKEGYLYFRYMDDLRVVCEDVFQARKILKEIIIEIRKLGLNVNSQKTFILRQEDPRIDEFIYKPIREIEQIESLLKSKKLKNVKIALPLLKKLSLKQIRKNKTQDREFRFCIHRLDTIARCKAVNSFFDFKRITRAIVDELVEQPFSTDVFARYLKSVELTKSNKAKIKAILSDPHRNVYSWQGYHLWLIFIFHGYKSKELLVLARRIVSENKKAPETAGAILYLGSCGGKDDREFVAVNFKNYKNYLMQRYGIIAIHELDYEDVVKIHVKDYVMKELVGTYMNMHANFNGQYFTPLPNTSVSDLYRDIPTYVG